ncbi:MAG: tail fiber domain-containing protein [Deltaproteobacteria bacterium]|nr:tail fiber domain-containing protein [Deltaproteobacteria bacterium]
MRSDRHAKEQIIPVDSEALLERVAALPIAEWSYIDEQGVRHVGPMAQDFHASFGLGGDDRSIHPVDAAGVTLAAVQALARRVEGLERDNGALRAHNTELSQRVEVLEGR